MQSLMKYTKVMNLTNLIPRNQSLRTIEVFDED